METTWVDFRAVKEAVSIEQVLTHYRVKVRTVHNSALRGRCPFPGHTSKSKGESFSVDTSKNAWACQSDSCVAARGGRKGGNVLDFVAAMERCTVRDAALKLQEWFGLGTQPKPMPQPINGATRDVGVPAVDVRLTGAAEANKPLTFILQLINSNHPYLAARGITPETASYFGVGFFPGRGSMAGRIVFPIHNKDGQLVAYAGRNITDSEPRWKFPSGFHKGQELYGLHLVEKSHVVVVESFWGVLALYQTGIPAVALMGRSLSEQQEELLAGFENVTLLLDGDAPGQEAGDEIAKRLVKRCYTKLLQLPEGKQPDHFSPAELQSIAGVT
jgi:DNA primase